MNYTDFRKIETLNSISREISSTIVDIRNFRDDAFFDTKSEFARLKKGITLEQIQADIEALEEIRARYGRAMIGTLEYVKFDIVNVRD